MEKQSYFRKFVGYDLEKKLSGQALIRANRVNIIRDRFRKIGPNLAM